MLFDSEKVNIELTQVTGYADIYSLSLPELTGKMSHFVKERITISNFMKDNIYLIITR